MTYSDSDAEKLAVLTPKVQASLNASNLDSYLRSSVASWLQNPAGVAQVFRSGANASGHGMFVGRRFQVFDRGVVR